MSLTPGTRIGTYEVIAAIGRGGMGEVYRAHDTKLRRDVALKVLPDLFTADADRLARFEREAHVLASLNHPNIAAIHGLEDAGPIKALVLELVDGPTLADRLLEGPMPLEDVRAIAIQITHALEAAHEQGIVHRDLKPANVAIRRDGTVKVLDFGLAAYRAGGAGGPGGAGGDLTNSPTIASPVALTGIGVLIGTAAYMSPEQARGRVADKRSDIWAFGCVLYEMLTRRRAFAGDDAMAVLAAILHIDPDWDAFPPGVPTGVVSVLKRCLKRDPNLRLRDIADVRLALDEAFSAPAPTAPIERPHGRVRTAAAYAGWAVAIASLAALALMPRGSQNVTVPLETRLQIVTPPSDSPESLAVSPDGRQIVFQARDGAQSLLWVRALDADQARPLRGTEGGSMPFWSPDGEAIGFFANGLLKRIDVQNGFPATLASAPQPRSGTWNRDGVIVFGPASVGPLQRVSAQGGQALPATSLLPGQTNHRWPVFLPDGRRFLMFALGTPETRGIYLGSLDPHSLTRVSDRESAYMFMPSSHLLFARAGALWARRLSRDHTAVEGEFLPVAPRVLVNGGTTGFTALSASASGVVAFRPSGATRQLAWIDRTGRTLAIVGSADDAQLGMDRLSRDGRALVARRTVEGNTDVWVIDTERGVPRRVTFDSAIDGSATFSPDGQRLAYGTDKRSDVWDIVVRAADGTGSETVLLESEENKNVFDWSPDGRYILYASQSEATGFDLWALPLFGTQQPIELARTPFREINGQFSPDGKWIALDSNETGQSEIYVQSFPQSGFRLRISSGGGTRPRWRLTGSGLELFYVAPGLELMAVTLMERGGTLDASPARTLFTLPSGSFEPTGSYEVAADGQRFLVPTLVSPVSPITVILGWRPPEP